LGALPVSANEVTPEPTVAIWEKGPPEVVARWILNPVMPVELSVQLRSISLAEITDGERLEGGARAVGLLAWTGEGQSRLKQATRSGNRNGAAAAAFRARRRGRLLTLETRFL